MARIRTIKPEFWTSEQVMECSLHARLLFIGLWNFCDDRGVHPAAYKTLKAEVFPGDDITGEDVKKMVAELIEQGLLGEFEHEGRRWWFVPGWNHQLINRPSPSRYPKPPRIAPLPLAAGQDEKASEIDESAENVAENTADSLSTHGALTDDSRSTHGALTEHSLQEGKGREGKGKERSRPAAAADLVRVHASSADAAAAFPPENQDSGKTAPESNADPTVGRAIELTAMLRKRGASLQASDPRVRGWAESGVSDAQALSALETAEQRRQDKGSAQPINAGLIDAIIAGGNHARAGPEPRQQQSLEDKNRMALAGWRPKELREETG